jgi:hypothetical protein
VIQNMPHQTNEVRYQNALAKGAAIAFNMAFNAFKIKRHP